jgi:hypothetical protein
VSLLGSESLFDEKNQKGPDREKDSMKKEKLHTQPTGRREEKQQQPQQRRRNNKGQERMRG